MSLDAIHLQGTEPVVLNRTLGYDGADVSRSAQTPHGYQMTEITNYALEKWVDIYPGVQSARMDTREVVLVCIQRAQELAGAFTLAEHATRKRYRKTLAEHARVLHALTYVSHPRICVQKSEQRKRLQIMKALKGPPNMGKSLIPQPPVPDDVEIKLIEKPPLQERVQ